jgi:hypothetical protein
VFGKTVAVRHPCLPSSLCWATKISLYVATIATTITNFEVPCLVVSVVWANNYILLKIKGKHPRLLQYALGITGFHYFVNVKLKSENVKKVIQMLPGFIFTYSGYILRNWYNNSSRSKNNNCT